MIFTWNVGPISASDVISYEKATRLLQTKNLSSWLLYCLQNKRWDKWQMWPFVELLLTHCPSCLVCSNCLKLWKTISVFRREKRGKMWGGGMGRGWVESYLEVTARVKWNIILLLLYWGLTLLCSVRDANKCRLQTTQYLGLIRWSLFQNRRLES